MPVRMQFTAIQPKFKRVVTPVMQREMEFLTRRFMTEVLTQASVYPPIPAGSTYQRTFELLRAWQVVNVSQGDAVRFAILNNVHDQRGRPYATLVHGNALGGGQWPIHNQHGWRKVYDVLQAMGGRGQLRLGLQAIITRNLGAV